MVAVRSASFVRDEHGGMAVAFACSLVALLITAGIAVDYARLQDVRSQLQRDLDAAVLGAATDPRAGETPQQSAERYFGSNWKDKIGANSVSVSVARSGSNRITGQASARVPTTLMALAGIPDILVDGISEVELTGQDIEVSLVLDTTLSMAGTKLAALQSAAKTLIDTAYELPDARDHINIGLVPFSQYVNVGVGNRGASWILVENDSTIEHADCRPVTPVIGTTNCRMETVSGYNDGVPYSYQAEVCDNLYGPEETDCTPWTEVKTWNGCVGSRNNPLDIQDEDYSSKVPGLMNTACGAPISPLTNDADALKTEIDNLVAVGDTYIPAGLMWGWATLSNDAPFEEARAYGEEVDGLPVRKIMVLMTDGANTLYPTYPYHETEISGVQADALMDQICTNVKSNGIEIYTVAFEVAEEDTKDRLRACASSLTKFFDAPTPEALGDAFKNIAKGFTPLRLAR
jgi:Flp pilus assembly protein TadG